MENATSIYNLQEEPSQRKMPVPVMSYSDVLNNMKEETTQVPMQAPMVVQAPSLEQAPIITEEILPMLQQPTVLEAKPEESEFQSKSFQTDMLVLLSVYITVHMASVQQWIQTKVPNLINPNTGAMSVLGLLMNGVLVIVIWNIAKKMVAKYLKEL